MGNLKKAIIKEARQKRKYAYVKVFIAKDGISIREVVKLQERPQGYSPKADGSEAAYAVGPFRTMGAAELFKANVGKYHSVAEAEMAFDKINGKL